MGFFEMKFEKWSLTSFWEIEEVQNSTLPNWSDWLEKVAFEMKFFVKFQTYLGCCDVTIRKWSWMNEFFRSRFVKTEYKQNDPI